MGNKKLILTFGILIALLNVFDGIATNYGYTFNFIEEINPFMNYLLTLSSELFLFYKFLISFLILIISFAIYHKSNERFQRPYLFSLYGISILYVGISIMHIYWLSYL